MYLLNGDGSKESGIECQDWYKATYSLNKSKTRILSVKVEYAFDRQQIYESFDWTRENLLNEIKSKNKNNGSPPVIIGYGKAFAKLNGRYPIHKNYKLKKVYAYMGLEYQEIRTILDKN